MGTNFYLMGHSGDDSPKYHIGKRSAAGKYCWDCGITLCKDGNEKIHSGRSEWHEVCPKCGKPEIDESLGNSSAGIELGFNKNNLIHNGVRSVCSFSWAQDPINILGNSYALIEDEYGHRYSNSQFRDMLVNMCPIQYYRSIGIEFC